MDEFKKAGIWRDDVIIKIAYGGSLMWSGKSEFEGAISYEEMV